MLLRFRNVFICLILAVAAFQNVKMRPEQIEELLRAMTQPKVAHTLVQEEFDGDEFTRRVVDPDGWPPRIIWGTVASVNDEELLE